MKNLFLKSRIPIFLSIACLLSSTFVRAQIGAMTITATGTGKTTGDIVAMTIYNPSDREVKVSLGPYFIPSGGQYQPYITLKQPVTVPAGQTIKINLQGFCADITKPPVDEKTNFKPITEWIKIDENTGGQPPPFQLRLDPDTKPAEMAPYLLQALNGISDRYDKLKTEGKITTPFSGSPEKEREAVIQQTFWIYTSELRKKPYTKEQFITRTYEQFEEKNNIKPITLPKEQKEKIDKGIDDFWNTFQAVGTEAKVLNVPSKPEDKPFTPTVSGPDVKPCDCTKCEVVTPMRIIDKETGKEITKDSVPWMANMLTFEPPVIRCNCPDECKPNTFVKIRYTPHYKYYSHSGSLWWQRPLEVNMRDPGYMEFEAEYECECANKPCGKGVEKRIIHFTEKNNCCDSIRRKNNGLLRFGFKDGYAQISDNTFWFESKDCGYQSFDFGFNLEVIFCNLSDDQVFSELITMAQSGLSKGNLSEFHSTRSIGMGGVSTDPNMSRYYGFSFSKQVNGKEMSVFISIDKEKCVFDVSMFCDGKMHEFSAPPYLSPGQLTAMANGLPAATNGQGWVNAMLILSHLARADEHNQGPAYQQALRNYLAKILNQVAVLMNNPKNAPLMAQLEALQKAAGECAAKGDFKLLDNVMEKMIPVVNAMN
ncbi:MAG: hypothetical protein HOP10_09935 [Chitinophagaceae bacterium]|nr:hypothetical protein [Chitinophagaceae bacterium]